MFSEVWDSWHMIVNKFHITPFGALLHRTIKPVCAIRKIWTDTSSKFWLLFHIHGNFNNWAYLSLYTATVGSITMLSLVCQNWHFLTTKTVLYIWVMCAFCLLKGCMFLTIEIFLNALYDPNLEFYFNKCVNASSFSQVDFVICFCHPLVFLNFNNQSVTFVVIVAILFRFLKWKKI